MTPFSPCEEHAEEKNNFMELLLAEMILQEEMVFLPQHFLIQ